MSIPTTDPAVIEISDVDAKRLQLEKEISDSDTSRVELEKKIHDADAKRLQLENEIAKTKAAMADVTEQLEKTKASTGESSDKKKVTTKNVVVTICIALLSLAALVFITVVVVNRVGSSKAAETALVSVKSAEASAKAELEDSNLNLQKLREELAVAKTAAEKDKENAESAKKAQEAFLAEQRAAYEKSEKESDLLRSRMAILEEAAKNPSKEVLSAVKQVVSEVRHDSAEAKASGDERLDSFQLQYGTAMLHKEKTPPGLRWIEVDGVQIPIFQNPRMGGQWAFLTGDKPGGVPTPPTVVTPMSGRVWVVFDNPSIAPKILNPDGQDMRLDLAIQDGVIVYGTRLN